MPVWIFRQVPVQLIKWFDKGNWASASSISEALRPSQSLKINHHFAFEHYLSLKCALISFSMLNASWETVLETLQNASFNIHMNLEHHSILVKVRASEIFKRI